MSTTMNDSEEYYCFRVRESVDNDGLEVGDNTVIIPRSYNFDLKKLRTELWKKFGVPKDRRIFYIDDDGDDVPIDSECEFHEALKLARNAFMVNTAIPLIVGSFQVPTSCSDDEQCSGMNEIYCPNKEQSRGINSNPVSSFTEKSGGSMPEPNPEFDKQKRPTRKIPSNQKNLDIKRCDESNEEQTESEDMKIPRESNASLRCYSDTVPPPWFTEYMEAMKKDMVSTITHEVVKNVTEMLNKRLDSLAYPPLKELGQSRSQSYSSLSKRHPRYSFDSNEKNQKRMRSQDEEQSSDASIERVDEPQNVNAVKSKQAKKDVISTISQEVVKEMTEMLNKIPLDPLTSVSSKKLGQSRSQSHLPSSKRLPRYFDSHSSEKNQRKMRPQDGERSSDNASMEHTYEPQNASSADVLRQLQKKLDLIGDATCASVKEEKRKKKYFQRTAQIFPDNLNSDIGKGQKQSTQNNAQEDFVPRKYLPLQVDPMPYNETPGMFENELRMSCSVTGHQMLDEGRCTRDVWCCDNPDIDKTSFWSCDHEEEDDDAFEIIQMPTLGSRDESITHPEELTTEQRRHDSNRDSPSFELLSEPPSPTCFMYFNEEHFSANEENSEQQPLRDHFYPAENPFKRKTVYVVDIHGRFYSDYELEQRDKQDLEKQSGGVYSFVTETLPVQDNVRCSKSSRPEQRSSERKKSPRDIVCDTRDNTSSSYDDVRNSHTSYLTVRTHCDSKSQSQCSCQSQTDSNDFTQSFHSHTTSVTDTTDVYNDAYGSGRYGEQVLTAKDVQEAATTTVTATATATTTATPTATATATTTPRNDVRVGGGCMKETRTNERHCHDADKCSSEYCSCAPHSTTQGISVDAPCQSGQATRSSDRSSSNVGSRKTSIGEPLGTAEPVHILPETLVTAAAHVGSIAYYTAREMFDKIRAHTREDSVTSRRGKVRR